jgi:hypothetical protein
MILFSVCSFPAAVSLKCPLLHLAQISSSLDRWAFMAAVNSDKIPSPLCAVIKVVAAPAPVAARPVHGFAAALPAALKAISRAFCAAAPAAMGAMPKDDKGLFSKMAK